MKARRTIHANLHRQIQLLRYPVQGASGQRDCLDEDLQGSALRARGCLWEWRRWLSAFLISLMLSNLPVKVVHALSPTVEDFPGTIILQDGKLIMRLETVPLCQVMAEFSRQSGIQVRWLNTCGEELISVVFTDLPLAEALPRILEQQQFLLVYHSTSTGRQLAEVWIGSLQRRGVPQWPSPAALAVVEAQNRAYWLDVVIEAAFRTEDPFQRLEALEYLAAHGATDPRIKIILSNLATSEPDPVVQGTASVLRAQMQ